MVWYKHTYILHTLHICRGEGLATTILQGTVPGGRRPGRQQKRWEDKIEEWTNMKFAFKHRTESIQRQTRMEETSQQCQWCPNNQYWLRVKKKNLKKLCFTHQCLKI